MNGLDESDLDKVRQIIKASGELIFAQRSGSWSFNLSLPTSDKDYFGVFVAPDPLHIPTQSFDHTVPGSDDDWVVYELGKYVELVLKGNPKVVEPLFATHYTFTTPTWDRVAAFLRPLVINRTTVAQYTSFASFEMKDALGKKVKAEAAIRKAFASKNGSSADSKAQGKSNDAQSDPEELTKELAAITLATHGKPFYHGLRLARESLRIQKGLAPKVWMDGEDREELMAIRTGKCTKTFEEIADQVKREIDLARAYTPSASSSEASGDASTSANASTETPSNTPIPDSIDPKVVGQWLVDFRMPMLLEIAKKESRKFASGSTSTASNPSSSASDPSSQAAPSADFQAVIDRSRTLLTSHGFSNAHILYVAPIGSEILRRLSSPGASTMDVAADYLVVYRLPVATVLNTTVDVPKVIYERPNAKSGQGIWAVEVVEARDGFSRHHALFESAVLLKHESQRFSNPIVWEDAAWAPFGELLAGALAKREVPSFGLLSHYLGVVTGLLRSTETWKTGGDSKAGKKSTGDEEPEIKNLAEFSDAGVLNAKMKSLYLSQRLLAQADLLLSRQGGDSPALLSAEDCSQLLRMRNVEAPLERAGAPSSAVISRTAVTTEGEAEGLRERLLETITALQTKLKAAKLPATFSKELKKALENEIRQARFDTM